MKPILAASLALCVALAACGTVSGNDTAQMPRNPDGGPAMTQNDAISFAAYALATPSYTHGNPARAARAVVAEDWLAGQWQLTPDFGQYGPVYEWEWGELRREVRAAIGVAPQASSQDLLNHMYAAAIALEAGNTEGARAQLQPPLFPLGPDRTLAALSNLPRFKNLEYSFAELRRNENRITSPCPGPNC